jgi:hypothetical protein
LTGLTVTQRSIRLIPELGRIDAKGFRNESINFLFQSLALAT